MTDNTISAYGLADYYAVHKDAESFTAKSPTEAILDYAEEGGVTDRALTVYAYNCKEVEPGWPEEEAEKLTDTLLEDYDDEYGGDDDPIIDDDRLTEFRAIASILIKYIVHRNPPSQCEPVGKRIYSPEEVAEILEGKS
jgi:hypothetical protein